MGFGFLVPLYIGEEMVAEMGSGGKQRVAQNGRDCEKHKGRKDCMGLVLATNFMRPRNRWFRILFFFFVDMGTLWSAR